MTYCALPFRHVFVEPRGIKPCCSYTKTHNMTIDQWISSDELKNIQKNMLDGRIDPGCENCLQNEARYGTGTRIDAQRQYGLETLTDTFIDYIDYRSSNVCNFKCRTCEPYFSNGIAQEARRNEILLKFHSIPQEKTVSTDEKDCQWIIDNLASLRRLMFTGGEPTRMPGVRSILEKIRVQDFPDLQIQIITNGSFSDPYWRNLAAKAPNINWTVSIDAVRSAAEIIRHGTDWSLIEDNIRFLAQNCHSLNFSTVISRLNVMQLRPLLEFTNEISTQYDRPNGRTQFIQFCVWPDHFNPYNWPDSLKSKVIDYVSNIINDSVNPDHNQLLESLLHRIRSTEFDEVSWNQGEEINDIYDQIRGENHRSLFMSFDQ